MNQFQKAQQKGREDFEKVFISNGSINLSTEDILWTFKVNDDGSRSVVLSPRNSNDSPIAVASWGRLMKLETIDEEAIEEYIRRNINKSPEPQSL